ncbi:MAG: hypothetical protein K8R46_13245 [Pirellulales bacterium]|nr:hypothetical protein [Pirellulales bacterium]
MISVKLIRFGLLFLLPINTTFATIINIPDDQPNIQAELNNTNLQSAGAFRIVAPPANQEDDLS